MTAVDEPVVAPPAPKPVETSTSETDPRPALRAEYEAKFGKKPFGGWSAEILREKLAAG
jgi:hypothetical protein